MRKVTEIGEWNFPFRIIETQPDGIIVDIPETYYIQLDSPGMELAGLEGFQDMIQVPTNAATVGMPASWDDVNNIMLFDIVIDKIKYSWNKKRGFKHVGLTSNGTIGIVKYKPHKGLLKFFGFTKKIVVSKKSPHPMLKVVDGYLSINGNSYSNTEFIIGPTGKKSTIGKIERISPDGKQSATKCKPSPIVEEPT